VKDISKNEEILVTLDGISIEQEIFKTWKIAQDILLNRANHKTLVKSILEPTKIEVKLKTDSFLFIEKLSNIEVFVESLSLNMDYNNIGYFYFILKRYQETVEPTLNRFKSQISKKYKEIKKRVKDKINQVIQENVLTACSVHTAHEQTLIDNRKDLVHYNKGDSIE
jgi:hypothetical protein